MPTKTTKPRSKKPRPSGDNADGAPTSGAASGNGKRLVIVESPAKAKTINRYLGNDYIVLASVGHVRDLPARPPKGTKRADDPVPGVDLKNDFEPTYEIIQGKNKTVADLKRAAKNAQAIYLATDMDREGEAIAWHVAEALGIEVADALRVVFNAITKDEIKKAFEHPRPLDMDKVYAQQARRILDRIVGYQVSPLLWKKVAGGLSAGRVQSVALRLVVEREREILIFIPDEYWKITGYFTIDPVQADALSKQWMKWLADAPTTKNGRTVNGRSQRDKLAWLAEHKSLVAELVEVAGEKFDPTNVDQALAVAQQAGFALNDKQILEDPDAKGPAKQKITLVGHLADNPDWRIKSLDTKRARSKPYAPFITSTLQQAAANQLGFSASTTMRAAQQLYEGVDIRSIGSVGLITYMRTDSTHLSAEALTMARDYISQNYGAKYLPEKPNFYASSNKAAQEAHEAIRPTDVSLSPNDPAVKNSLDERQLKLYRLIWQRFVACQMTPAEWDTTTYLIAASVTAAGGSQRLELVFRGSGRVLVFDGFYKAVGIPHPADEAILPPLTENQPVAPLQIDPTQHFTSPPPRYSEASLVKKLEAEGIGRPSTYAAIIDTIVKRNYVAKESSRFFATDLGMVVSDKLIEAFPEIMDVGYTREMEAELDRIEDQHHDWRQMLRAFYKPFKTSLDAAHMDLSHAKAETFPAPKEYKCPQCGAPTEYRFGKNGRFLSCTRYPDCKYAAPINREGKPQEPQATEVACPTCGSPMTLRKGRFGPFLSCTKYPQCKGVVNLDRKGHVKQPSPPPLQIDLTCPKCESPLYLRRSKRGPWLSCSKYPKCRGRLAWTKLDEAVQKKLDKALTDHEAQHPMPTIKNLTGKPVGPEYTPTLPSSESSPPDDAVQEPEPAMAED